MKQFVRHFVLQYGWVFTVFHTIHLAFGTKYIPYVPYVCALLFTLAMVYIERDEKKKPTMESPQMVGHNADVSTNG